MHRSTGVLGMRPVTVPAANIAVFESLSVRSIDALLTELAMLSFCATNAAREEVTTSRATRMNDRANADSCSTRLLRERPRRLCTTAPTGGSGRVVMVPLSDDRRADLSDYRQITRKG